MTGRWYATSVCPIANDANVAFTPGNNTIVFDSVDSMESAPTSIQSLMTIFSSTKFLNFSNSWFCRFSSWCAMSNVFSSSHQQELCAFVLLSSVCLKMPSFLQSVFQFLCHYKKHRLQHVFHQPLLSSFCSFSSVTFTTSCRILH